MEKVSDKVLRFEFEVRIFISFTIVAAVCMASFTLQAGQANIAILLLTGVGFTYKTASSLGFLFVTLVMAIASLFRMWAGSLLTPQRMMHFKVQYDTLITEGPYQIVRNPIYLADLLAFCGFALSLPVIGLLLPVLIYLHYCRLVKYEEISLAKQFPEAFFRYQARVPRLLPPISTIQKLGSLLKNMSITTEGFRHNALYVLFIPGFVVAAFTHELMYAIFIGLPAVVDWAVMHIRMGLHKTNPEKKERIKQPEEKRKLNKKVMGDILYAQCWEDPQIDRAAFQIQPDDVIFSITSGGCNLITFLLDNPRQIIALDLNPFQNYLLELKIAAFKSLSYSEMLEFVGVRLSSRRTMLYQGLRPCLSAEAKEYWDSQTDKIRQGIIHCGRYERYMRLLKKLITFVMGWPLIRKFCEIDNPHQKNEIFHQRWENNWWRLFTGILLSRTLMTLLFDKAFFAQLDENFAFGKHFSQKVKYALIKLSPRDSYFLSYILLGRYYSEAHLPPYLIKENFQTIRNRLDRIRIVTANCEHFFATLSDNSISKFNFTNIFEWMSPQNYQKLLEETIRVAKDGAILTYRNLLVFRERPAVLAEEIRPLKVVADKLYRQDLSFIYKNYVVEKIKKVPS